MSQGFFEVHVDSETDDTIVKRLIRAKDVREIFERREDGDTGTYAVIALDDNYGEEIYPKESYDQVLGLLEVADDGRVVVLGGDSKATSFTYSGRR